MRKISSAIFIMSAVGAGFAISLLVGGGVSLAMNTVGNLKPYVVDLSENNPELLVASASASVEKVEKMYVTKGGAVFPDVSAKAFIAFDLESGDVIVSRKPEQVYPIASITKLMTAVASEDVYGLAETLTVSKDAIATYGRQGNLEVGERYTVKEMLYPMLLESSNDAAEVLAMHENRRAFLSYMNKRGESLGLTHTSFADASGLSPGNTSTIKDLTKLVQYIYDERKDVFKITQLKSYSLRGKTWHANNRFKNDANFIGGKNGYTEVAHQTHVGLFRLPLEGDSVFRDIGIIILKSDSAVKDTRGIISYLNKNVYFE